ncbi:O-antigen ligase family protein [Lutibacter sp. TH_r2]|uniref:O-antigen ligase family protein n=1 Tax=Lutibacter sp. TH_r2 TaxID=3082083 RepID=UPI002954FF18|nr:O-antigen ligase family protein [Lutibacter sp. TH_r2]MDV7187787.1 O-antigen ligase family protein [Lutibacter sp. TH_r2]
MMYSFYFFNLPYKLSGYDYFAKAIGITFIPALSIYFTPMDKIKSQFIAKWIYIILFSIAIINLFPYKLPINYGRSSGILKIYPIIFGHIGTTLSLFSLYFYVYPCYNLLKTKGVLNILINSISFLVGIMIIIVSGSRGPFLSLLGGIFLFVFFNRKLLLKNMSLKFKIIFPILNIGIVWGVLKFYKSSFLERSMSFFQGTDQSSSIRLDLWRISFEKFIENPMVGNTFLLEYFWNSKTSMMHPHNFLIEAFYTLGIVGGVIFLVICFLAIKISFKLIVTSNYSWISLYFIQYLFFSFVSSSIYQNYKFWIAVAFLFSIKNYLLKDKQNFKIK